MTRSEQQLTTLEQIAQDAQRTEYPKGVMVDWAPGYEETASALYAYEFFRMVKPDVVIELINAIRHERADNARLREQLAAAERVVEATRQFQYPRPLHQVFSERYFEVKNSLADYDSLTEEEAEDEID